MKQKFKKSSDILSIKSKATLTRDNKSILLTALVGSAVLIAVGAGCTNSNSAADGGTTTGTSPTSSNSKGNISGAGSTFVQPVMMEWVKQYQKDNPGTTINYQGVGSGAGISQYQAGTVNFGASDAPLNDAGILKLGKPTSLFPVACGCVAISYNLPSVTTPIKLSGATLADIYLGKIKVWNDPAIASDNPGVSLPSTNITVVSRADASGTTYIFTSYLSSVSPEWKTKFGAQKTLKWPTGISAPQSAGVAGDVKQTEGAIGYVEFAYTIQAKMVSAELKNLSGAYVAPSLDGTIAAETASADTLAKDLRNPIVNAPGATSYPIVGFTYALVPIGSKDATAAPMQAFLKYAVTDGQALGKPLQYAPLPAPVVTLVEKKISAITGK